MRYSQVITAVMLLAMSVELMATSNKPSVSTEVPIYPRTPELEQRLTAALHSKGGEYRPRTEHLNADGSPVYVNRLIL
ncbi:MAG: hypothetical protein GY753_04770, partial [Gammaproteobacteria bacterium]|nr:hypothetical protein [Gammaproteobacteria bacterium]